MFPTSRSVSPRQIICSRKSNGPGRRQDRPNGIWDLQKETPEIIPPQLWPRNSPDLNPVDYSVWFYCKRRCTKYASLIWMQLKQQLRAEWAKQSHVVIAAAIRQWRQR